MSAPSRVPSSKLIYHSSFPLRDFSWSDETYFSLFDLKLLGKEADCSICLDHDDEDKTYFWILSCGHIFHYDCAVKWFCSLTDNSCPLCRQVVTIVPRGDLIMVELLNHGQWRLFPDQPHPQGGCCICRVKDKDKKKDEETKIRDDFWITLESGYEYHVSCLKEWLAIRYVSPLENRTPKYQV